DCGNASSDLIIPNAFSPNNDGENDVLMIFYKKGIFCITEFELNIFNRWGQKVFETARATDYWNGTFNGKMLSSGVYVYYCKIKTTDGQSAVKKGNISILR
ncbi:MAG TPA: gliding motility-associated C-terminal domain-containing protein, partial [Bacteroidia bacterium]